jgi:hypothetical protein
MCRLLIIDRFSAEQVTIENEMSVLFYSDYCAINGVKLKVILYYFPPNFQYISLISKNY